jgi:CitMHS family citrate-Mg2+:H+ or citrate-Ca2+:H+ symporter
MLSFSGFLIIFGFIYLITTRRMAAFTALVILPVLVALFGGFAPELGAMMLKGVSTIAPTAVMMMFAIIYFGIMADVGLFDSLIIKILHTVKGDPLKIIIGTVILAMIASLEGEGAVVFMIVGAALLPIYQKLHMNPVILAVICVMDAAVKNLFPWAAPSARVLTALKLEASAVFHPLIPVIIAGYCWVFLAAYVLGKRERKRLGVTEIDASIIEKLSIEVTSRHAQHKRPRLFFINLTMTLVLMAVLFANIVPIPVAFIIATALALGINYLHIEEQQSHLISHAKEAMTVIVVIFAAGIFLGVLTETKMTEAMAHTLVSFIPTSMGSHFALITAILSAPLTFLMSNDAFYFGVLPILNQMASSYGVSSAEIGRASLLGTPMHMLSPLVAALWLLVGICKISFADLQRGGIWWCAGLMLLNIVVALLTGALTF